MLGSDTRAGRAATAGRREINHARGAAATAARVAQAAAAALLLLATAAPALAQPFPAEQAATPAAGPSLTQRGIPAEATAENGVLARERALAAGRRLAWERLASEAGASPGSLSDNQIEAMVASIVIEQERVTPTRYSGRITVNFNPSRVRSALGSRATAAARPEAAPAERGDGTAALPSVAAPQGPPASNWVEAVATYRSLNEWIELRRRLPAPGPSRPWTSSASPWTRRGSASACARRPGGGRGAWPRSASPWCRSAGAGRAKPGGWALPEGGDAGRRPTAGRGGGGRGRRDPARGARHARHPAQPHHHGPALRRAGHGLADPERAARPRLLLVRRRRRVRRGGRLAGAGAERPLRLGAILDPMADKLLLVCVYVTLAAIGVLPDWLAILVVFRDLVIVGGVLVLWVLGQPPAIRPMMLSKLNTALQIALAAVALLLAGFDLRADGLLSAMVWTVAGTTLASGAIYVAAALRKQRGGQRGGGEGA
jgi:hypothetical protein